jgi:putative acetyltransferase
VPGERSREAAIELADHWLNLRRLSLVVFVDNSIACEMYRRLGFVVEGTMVGYGFRKGKYLDAHLMARLNGAKLSSGSV